MRARFLTADVDTISISKSVSFEQLSFHSTLYLGGNGLVAAGSVHGSAIDLEVTSSVLLTACSLCGSLTCLSFA